MNSIPTLPSSTVGRAQRPSPEPLEAPLAIPGAGRASGGGPSSWPGLRRLRVPVRLLRFILRHPLAGRHPAASLLRLLRWQIGGRLTGMPAVMPFVGPTRLLLQRGHSSATANLYAGLSDFAEMGFLLHLLRPGDLFADIGANIGAYTVLAAGVVGAEVLAFEPSPTTLPHLRDNLRLNELEGRVTLLPLALGERPGTLRLSARRGAANRVLLEREAEDAVHISVSTLDEILPHRTPLLLKLDVEGYEARVLAGATRLLARPGLQAVLVETMAHAERYGDSTGRIDTLLRGQGFAPFDYDPRRRALTPRDAPGDPNTLYLRQVNMVAARLATAPAVPVLGERF
ncbi:FkbM family methyltransferase [Roseomonas gilardii]|uniref:FkbM family methyltransferase n=1 Tax=Roseomonas gilardii TaxID=257708 RepID=A0ABU3MF72_9PROT|nr:FkbM family methyltransferase [Roseomonas gilardii]MDT8331618.1 FkbM family methyltransferase [Roseomonas gilardii]